MYKNLEKVRQFFSVASHSRTLSLLVILLIIAAVPLTVFVAQKQQEIRQRAEESSDRCMCIGSYWIPIDSDDKCSLHGERCGEINGACRNDADCGNIKSCVNVECNREKVCKHTNNYKPEGTDCDSGVCDGKGQCVQIINCDPRDLNSCADGNPCTEDTCEYSTDPVEHTFCDHTNKDAGTDCKFNPETYKAINACDGNGNCNQIVGGGGLTCDDYNHPENLLESRCYYSECPQGWDEAVAWNCEDSSKKCCKRRLQSGGVKCEHNGTKYNPGDKRWECTNPKIKGPCRESEGVGIPWVCNENKEWSNANINGECIAECKPEAGSPSQPQCEQISSPNMSYQCFNNCSSAEGWVKFTGSCPANQVCCAKSNQTGSGGSGGTGGTTGGSAPSCDSSQVQMSFSPVNPKVGDTITFNVSGSQGSTYINDAWSQDGGVDCSGGFWGRKDCLAKKEGTYNWTHKWKNCAPSDCSKTSSECSKELSFTINPNPTPTIASCPALGTADAPSELKYTCDTTNKKINISWKKPSNPNVTFYSIRVDKNPHSWNGNCSSPSTGDSCADPTTTSYTIENIDQNATYRVWISSRDKCGNFGPILGTKADITFSCRYPDLQAYWVDGSDWTPNAPRIDLIVRDYIINDEKVCIPEGEKNKIEIYNSETGTKVGLLKDYQTVPAGGYQPGKSDYNCGAYWDWGKHTAFRLFGTKQQIKEKGSPSLPSKIKFKIPDYTNLSNEVELGATTPPATILTPTRIPKCSTPT